MSGTNPSKLGIGFKVVVLIAFLLGPALWVNLTPRGYAGGRSRDLDARKVRNESAIAAMLGELRTSISDIIMIKTERYMHSGVGYTIHMTDSTMGAAATMDSLDAHQEGVGSPAAETAVPEGRAPTPNSTTLIPSPEDDYRGVIGSLQRKVKPWRAPANAHQQHTDGRQMLPWFRVSTLGDPNHVDSFTLGGYWLSRHSRGEAATFLEEGIEHNPDAFQLQLVLAQIRFRKVRESSDDFVNPTEAELVICREVLVSFRKAAELALEQRPHNDLEDNPAWRGYLEDDAWTAYRMAVLTEKYYGSNDEAVALAKKIVSIAGADDVTLMRISKENERGGQE